eukprot:scaffold14803_cov297-Alexandrium_tamarense.AAC.2
MHMILFASKTQDCKAWQQTWRNSSLTSHKSSCHLLTSSYTMKTSISANTLVLLLATLVVVFPSSIHAKKDSYRLFRRLPKASKKQGTYPPSSSRDPTPPSKSDKHFSMGKTVKTKALKTKALKHHCAKSYKASSN